jgi:hypothetical protein
MVAAPPTLSLNATTLRLNPTVRHLSATAHQPNRAQAADHEATAAVAVDVPPAEVVLTAAAVVVAAVDIHLQEVVTAAEGS